MNSIRDFIEKIRNDTLFRVNFIKTTLLFIVTYSFLFYVATELKEANILSQQNIELFITKYTSISWLIYIALLVIAIMSPLPDTPIVLAGGYIFSPITGIILTIVAQILGATADFYLARFLGKGFVTKKFPESTAQLNTYVEKLGWQTIFFMRLTPTLSFDLLSYASGLSSISFRTYILATIGGMIPLSIITTLLGHSAGIHSQKFAIITILVGALFIIITTYIFNKFFKNKIIK